MSEGGDWGPAERLTRRVVHPYFAMMHRLRWSGTGNVPRRGPVILAANHQSFYDPVMITLAARRRVRYLAWDYYCNMPVLGRLMGLYGTVPVDLDAPAPTALARLLEVLEGGGACGIFPEGGRAPDGLPQAPQPGVGLLALRSGAPIVPVTICGAYRAWPRGCTLPRPSPIRLHFGRPLHAEDLCPGLPRSQRRRRVAWELMLRIADGFAALGRQELGAASRRRLQDLQAGRRLTPP